LAILLGMPLLRCFGRLFREICKMANRLEGSDSAQEPGIEQRKIPVEAHQVADRVAVRGEVKQRKQTVQHKTLLPSASHIYAG